jgi:hypothetical protein
MVSRRINAPVPVPEDIELFLRIETVKAGRKQRENQCEFLVRQIASIALANHIILRTIGLVPRHHESPEVSANSRPREAGQPISGHAPSAFTHPQSLSQPALQCYFD